MNLNDPWPQANDFVAKRPADLPVIVFSPMGTSFTGHLQATRNKPKTFVAATQKYEWLAEGVHMMRTIWDMDRSRLCIVNGDKTVDEKLKVIGTTLHRVPLARWLDEWKAIGFTDEMKKMAAYYKQICQEGRRAQRPGHSQRRADLRRGQADHGGRELRRDFAQLPRAGRRPQDSLPAVPRLAADQRRGRRGLLRMRLERGDHAAADELPLPPARLHAGPLPEHHRGHAHGGPLLVRRRSSADSTSRPSR